MNGLFVTGTDTGVGKTFVAAALLAGLREGGIDAVPAKPVQTGCTRQGDSLSAPDLDFCLDAAGLQPDAEERRRMCPCRFEAACSPHLAASIARSPISVPALRDAVADLASRRDCVIVEGAGGVMVPLNDRQTSLDLMAELKLPVILVARPSLGTLNHTFLSLHALRDSGLIVAAIIVVDTVNTKWTYIEEDNLQVLTRHAGVPVVDRLPYLGPAPVPVERLAAAGRALARVLQPHIWTDDE